jgi:ATP-binding cassette subfamily B protein
VLIDAPAPDVHPLRRLLRYARPFRRRIRWAATCSVLNKIFDLAPPVLIGTAVDVVVRREESILATFGFTTAASQLRALAIATLVIWVLESLFEYLSAVAWRNLAQTLQHDLRLDAYRHIGGLELRYFEDRSTGGLMSVLSDDVNQLERFLDGGADELIKLFTTVVMVSAAFFALAPEVAWLAMLPVPFVIWGSLSFQKRIAPRYDDVRERVAHLNARLANNLSGMATIKSFSAQPYEVRRMTGVSDEYRASNERAIRLSSAFSPLIRMVIVVGFTTTLVYGGWLALDDRLEVAAYSVMVFMTQRLLWPLTSLGRTLDLYQRAMASTRRILDLLDTRSTIVDGPTTLDPAAVRGDVAFEGVTFAYHAGLPVLRDLTIRCPAGETTAIVGSTGSGKTTIIKLLLRFYETDADGGARAGAVTMDGHDVRTLRLEDLRNAVALVSQDVFLFHGTVRQNIAYGRASQEHHDPDEVDFDAIVDAARAAEAHEFITRLPDGYDTVIGERGQKLSGGQRQRLSMARAILKDAPILVLDEATSSVDNETEAAIQRSLGRIAVGRTTIVIAHRLSTVRGAHRIYVLEGGAVRETGRHEDLLEQAGLYAALWRVQTGSAVPAPGRGEVGDRGSMGVDSDGGPATSASSGGAIRSSDGSPDRRGAEGSAHDAVRREAHRVSNVRINKARHSFDVTLEDRPVTVGRASENTVVLRSSRVSREHCVIERVEGAVRLRDLDSRHGTRLNGEPVRTATLASGDTIRVGSYEILYGTNGKLTIARAGEIDVAGAETTDERERLEVERAQLDSLRTTLEQSKADLERQRAAFEDERRQAATNATPAPVPDDDLAREREELEALRAELAQQRAALDEARPAANTDEVEDETIDAAAVAMDGVVHDERAAELDEAEEALQRREAAWEETRRLEADELTRQGEGLEATERELGERRTAIDAELETLASRSAEIDDARAEVHTQRDALERERAGVAADRAALDEEREGHAEALSTLQAEVESMRTTIADQARQALEREQELQRRAETAEAEQIAASTRAEELTKRIEREALKLDEAAKHARALQLHLKEVESARSAEALRADGAERGLGQLRRAIEELKASSDRLSSSQRAVRAIEALWLETDEHVDKAERFGHRDPGQEEQRDQIAEHLEDAHEQRDMAVMELQELVIRIHAAMTPRPDAAPPREPATPSRSRGLLGFLRSS